MTVVLVAVYVPIGFQGGLTGALFAEFAFALVGAVTVSGDRRADALADAVLAAIEKSRSAAPRLGIEIYFVHRSRVQSAARRL